MIENYIKLIDAIKNKKEDLEKQFNDLGDKFDNAKTKDEKQSISKDMLKIKEERNNLINLRKEYKLAMYEYNQLKKEPTIDQNKLNDKEKVIKELENKITNYCNVQENQKEETQEKEKTLEKGKIYKVKELAHKVGNGISVANDVVNEGVKVTGKALSITLISVLSLFSILSGIGALSALFGQAALIEKIIGTLVYGGISYLTGFSAVASSKAFTASKIEGDALKNLIESTKESKKKK